MRRNVFAQGALVVALCWAAEASAATSYDLRGDWSRKANPNGPWALLQGASALPADADWTPLSNTDTAYNPTGGHIKQPAFAPGNAPGNFLPAFFKAAVTPESTGFGWLKGDVVLHTTDGFNGAGEGPASAVFTAPAAGTAKLSGYVYNARNINRPQAWRLSVNGVVKDSGALPGDGSITRSTRTTFKLGKVALSLGDTVTLEIYENGGSSGAGDFVGLDLKVVYK